MEFAQVVNRRRTTRQFTGQPVDKKIIERIIDAGIKAPSFDHMRKWNFIVVTDAAVKAQILDTIKALPCNIDEPKNPFQEMVKIAFPKQR